MWYKTRLAHMGTVELGGSIVLPLSLVLRHIDIFYHVPFFQISRYSLISYYSGVCFFFSFTVVVLICEVSRVRYSHIVHEIFDPIPIPYISFFCNHFVSIQKTALNFV